MTGRDLTREATCARCVFFQRATAEQDHDEAFDGECRRQAPRLRFGRFDDPVTAAWPPVRADDWCGEYRNDQMSLPLAGEAR